MAMREHAGMVSLKQAEAAAALEGFSEEDFAVFAIPGFEARMPQVRARIKPKLTALGQALAPRLSETLEEIVYPHVAQHLRRTLNPPEETWVAFAREKRAYKPFAHLRVAISAETVRVLAFVEDDAADKERFARNLQANAEALSAYLAHHPTVRAYEMRDADGEPLHGHALNADTLRAFGARMLRVKGQHAIFGIPFAQTHPVVQSGPEFFAAVIEAAAVLKPLYDCGKSSAAGLTSPPGRL